MQCRKMTLFNTQTLLLCRLETGWVLREVVNLDISLFVLMH